MDFGAVDAGKGEGLEVDAGGEAASERVREWDPVSREREVSQGERKCGKRFEEEFVDSDSSLGGEDVNADEGVG